MPNYASNRNVRTYLATQSAFSTIPTVTTSNYVIHSDCSLTGTTADIKDPGITGSRQELPPQPGRRNGDWSFTTSLRGSGTAGTVPPHLDVLFQSIMGQASTDVADTSNTYNLSDNIKTFALFHYRHDQAGGTAVTQQIGSLCGVTDATFTLGSDVATLACNGKAAFVLDNDNFASYLTAWKGGLGAFPAEPAAPTTRPLENAIGFTGAITADGDSIVEIKTATIKVTTGNQLITDDFGSFTGTGWQGDARTFELSMTLDDSDGTGVKNLKQKAFAYDPIDITLQVGTNAGNTFTFSLKSVVMKNPKFSPGPNGRWRLDFSSSTAHGTTLSGTDAFSIACT